MSATNRGLARQKADFYPTPEWCTRRLLERLSPHRSSKADHRFRDSFKWIEPAAGEGAIIKAVESHAHKMSHFWPGTRSWTAWEIREECEAPLKELTDRVAIGDFLKTYGSDRYDVAITNPPFQFCREFWQAMRPIANWTVLLTRLNWFGSAERRDMFVDDRPRYIFLLPNRPPFAVNAKGKPGTDATEYCWAVWNGTPDSTIFDWLELTSKEEKRAHIMTILERNKIDANSA